MGAVVECHFCQFTKNSAAKLKKFFNIVKLSFKIYFNFSLEFIEKFIKKHIQRQPPKLGIANRSAQALGSNNPAPQGRRIKNKPARVVFLTMVLY
ncbi:MAG: hypothetical protein A2301_03565 [Candidatus Magasanikbacteria bacterium RIFOXYB2_FULL_40_13]|uniref:Uncharacterized protein n=1 Tax=Candidatus Magasanikbacteria bacterium RIFOXYB1_FULL_40_15 TaxID=1798697 RepID=A0A1F6NEI0_9BACT|nr:MAG: hypothetical protein A2373_03010 [Candidatus Magasanikbacteria bacterium RIFOXYB1_FULL_40_15]OGH86923.1 MAG: hypothetical protein A2301_03565 [Candidatus Magasanikbacteria bacterium RIFOXYB2_FULL_40_13]